VDKSSIKKNGKGTQVSTKIKTKKGVVKRD